MTDSCYVGISGFPLQNKDKTAWTNIRREGHPVTHPTWAIIIGILILKCRAPQWILASVSTFWMCCVIIFVQEEIPNPCYKQTKNMSGKSGRSNRLLVMICRIGVIIPVRKLEFSGMNIEKTVENIP